MAYIGCVEIEVTLVHCFALLCIALHGANSPAATDTEDMPANGALRTSMLACSLCSCPLIPTGTGTQHPLSQMSHIQKKLYCCVVRSKCNVQSS